MPGSKDIETVLRTIGIPIAYHQFTQLKNQLVPDPPDLVYTISPEEARGADGKNLVVQRRITIELYTDVKDTDLEQQIEVILNSTEWSKYEDYIASEMLYKVSYEYDVLEKIRR